MNDTYFLTIITGVSYYNEYERFLREYNIHTIMSTLCRGTAQKKTLDLLGLENTDKIMLITIISGSISEQIIKALVSEMGINIPGRGIAFTIPVDSLGGSSAMRYLTEGQNIKINEAKSMNESKYTLIIAITENGCSDRVMDAARLANAKGGTVVHAKGTGTESSARFFNISIAAEKEMVYIISRREDKSAIMRSIMEYTGMQTSAHTAVFSLPVEDLTGLKSLE